MSQRLIGAGKILLLGDSARKNPALSECSGEFGSIHSRFGGVCDKPMPHWSGPIGLHSAMPAIQTPGLGRNGHTTTLP